MPLYSRQIEFESIINFRDLGGYQNLDGRQVAWRRVFRSGNFCHISGNDLDRLNKELGLRTILDLRSSLEIERQGTGLLADSGLKYFNVSLIADGGDREGNKRRYKELKNMGEVYISLSRQEKFGKQIIEALKIIADPDNHPLAFHCFTGKDRTGVLTAFVLSILDIPDKEISEDYSLSTPYIEKMIREMKSNTQKAANEEGLPDYFWDTSAGLMESFLITLKGEYGSVRGYLKEHGAENNLFNQLESALLV